MSEAAARPAAVRAAGIAAPLGFAVSVVAAVNFAVAGSMLGAGLGALTALAAFALMAWAMRRRALDGRTRLPSPERARLRFQTLNAVWVVAFVLSFVFLAPLAAQASHLAARIAFVAAPVLALVGMGVEFVRMIVLSDEMERRHHVTACAAAGGTLVAGATLWSVLQTSAPSLPDLEGWMLMPAFAVLYALVMMRLEPAQP